MKKLFVLSCLLCTIIAAEGQNTFTREQVLNMTEDQLMDLSMEEFAEAIKAVGVSNPDELFAMIMNKNVSSASKSDESTFDSPLSTSVITHDEIRRFGCMSIEEALRLIPGTIVYEKANGVFDVHLRGLSNIPDNNFIYSTDNCNTLMMIDGRQVFNYSTGTTFWESFPIGIDDIDRIEVVRGPASALYGANAVTGVINIITFKGNASQKSVVGNISYGNQNTTTADVSLRKSFLNDKLFIGTSVNMQSRERETDKIYVIPREGLYVVNDYMAIQKGEDLMYGLGYDFMTKTAVDDTPTKMTQNAMYTPTRKSRLEIPYEDLEVMIKKGYLIDLSKGGSVDPHTLSAIRYITYNQTQSNFVKATNARLQAMGVPVSIPDSLFAAYAAVSDYADAEELYKDPNMARENIGANSYIHFTPNKNVDISLNIGYQDSKAFSSSYRDDYYAMSVRNERSTYSNLTAAIYGFNIQATHWAGRQNYCVGFPGYEMDFKQYSAQVDYEFNLLKNVQNQSLKIRPGVSWLQYELSDEDYKNYTPKGTPIYGYLNGTSKLTTQAAMLRFDYRLHDLRVIAAYRAEKLNIPDELTNTFQFGATYSVNDNNCLRFVYGRANRSSFTVNSSSNYNYDRTGMMTPNYMTFLANEDADVMQLDNIEIGFRSRPTPRMLLDLEAFYSKSKQYGALISDKSQFEVSLDDVKSAIGTGFDTSNTLLVAQKVFEMLKTRSYMQYQNVPLEPKQMGISLGLDWIATDKLIVKMNANIQRTVIDNYSEYSQPLAITKQLIAAAQKAAMLQTAMTQQIAADPNMSMMKYFIDMVFDIPEDRYYRRSDNGDVIGLNLDLMASEGFDLNAHRKDSSNPYGFGVSEDMSFVALGSSTDRPEWKMQNNVKSKSIPSFYGSLGFIYKPLEQLSVSANANYMGKRTYNIKGGASTVSETINSRFTLNMKIGYQPVQGFEVYFNARNLFDNEKREFVYSDKIGGIYSIGASFAF